EPLRDLLGAFRRDAAGDTAAFATFADVLDYCRCSADPVGRIVLALFGYRDPERQARADDICTALQLTNFWQDVAGDLARGRVYIPQEDLDRFPESRAALAAGATNDDFRRLLAFEVARTRDLFARGLPLAELVTGRLAREVRLFARGGLAILGRIAAVIAGVEMDLRRDRYETWEDDLAAYCYRVAGAVGLVCIQVFGYRNPSARQYAVELGLAFQLTNILRDVAEDAQRGRIYLPRADLRQFGC